MNEDDWIVGRQFGRLKVMKRLDDNANAKSKNLKAVVLVQCSCGQRLRMPRYYLVRKPNPKTHCGCLGGPQSKKEAKNTVEYKPEYTSWKMMIARCYDAKHISYKDYGGRGISVCDRWLDQVWGFKNFLDDMKLKPSIHHTLDRKQVNGNYEPNNCRWATAEEQAANKR